jgi:branched-chain amino acid transport system permease protein
MFAQHLADGLLTGAIVSLGAIGLTMTMNILRFANFGHSEFLTWGAFAAYATFGLVGGIDAWVGGAFGPLSFGPALIVSMIVAVAATAALALLLDRLVFRRLRATAGEMTLVFASFGVALLIRNVLLLGFGHDPKYFSRKIQMSVELLPGMRVLPDQIFVFLFTLALMLALHLFLSRSRTGIAMRAVSENPDLARLNGVDTAAVIRWTWIIGGGLAAIAGVCYGMTVQVRPELGFGLILPLFAAAIVGGTGSIYGAVLGGFIVGLAENLAIMVIPSGYKPAIPFLVILLVLYVRPNGLFGERT